MKTVTLYRSDFKTIDGESTFDYVLDQLGIPKAEWEDIDEIEVTRP